MKTDIANANRLVEQNFGLVREFMKRQAPWIDRDDLFSLSMLGLMLASRYYDPERGTQFSTCANKFMKTELRHYLHSVKRKKDKGWVQPKSLYHHDGEQRQVRDRCRRPDELVSERDWARYYLDIGLSRLTESERRLLLAHLVEGKQLIELANGHSWQRCQEIVNQAKGKARRAIESHIATQPFRRLPDVVQSGHGNTTSSGKRRRAG